MPKATSAAEALSPAPTEEDRRYDATLRPTRLTDYVGQRKVAENLAHDGGSIGRELRRLDDRAVAGGNGRDR